MLTATASQRMQQEYTTRLHDFNKRAANSGVNPISTPLYMQSIVYDARSIVGLIFIHHHYVHGSASLTQFLPSVYPTGAIEAMAEDL